MAREFFAGMGPETEDDLTSYQDALRWEDLDCKISGRFIDIDPPTTFQHMPINFGAPDLNAHVCSTRPPQPITPGRYLCNCGMVMFVWNGKTLAMQPTEQARIFKLIPETPA